MKAQKTYFTLLFVITCFFFPLFVSNAENKTETNQERTVHVISIDGEIKAGTLRFFERAKRIAQEDGSDLFFITLETPGGLVTATRSIAGLMLGTDLPVAVFVSHPGGWAFSAGTFILLAADYAFVHPDASIGAAEPRVLGMNELEGEDPKITESMAGWIRSLARTHDRNEEIAERFVRENLTLTGREALREDIIDGTPGDIEEALGLLGFTEYRIHYIAPTFGERIFDALSHPYLVSLFLAIGGLGILFAFRTGEFEITGVIGFILLLLGLWGMGVISFSVLGTLLFVTGIALLVVELFIEPGFGVFGILGVLALVLGIFTFAEEPLLHTPIMSAMTALVAGIAIGVTTYFLIAGRGVSKTLRTSPTTGPESLVGAKARTISILSPDGQVRLKGEIWKARSVDDIEIPEHTDVEVAFVRGNTLVVKKGDM